MWGRRTVFPERSWYKHIERFICHESLTNVRPDLWLTSVKNASIPPIPPNWCAPGPAERRHRLRSPVRKSTRPMVERVCRDQWRGAMPPWWWFPILQAFILASELVLTVHLSGVRVLCAKMEHAAWGKIQATVMKNLKSTRRANCSTPVFLVCFDSIQACVHSMWRMCECVRAPKRERGWVQCAGMRGRTSPGAE